MSAISIRLLGPGRQPEIHEVGLDENIGAWKERKFSEDIQEGRRVTIVHFGQRLPDDISFRHAGIQTGDALHCSVSSFQIQQDVRQQTEHDFAPVILAMLLLLLNLAALGAFITPSYRSRFFTPASSTVLVILTSIVVPLSFRIIIPSFRRIPS